MKDAYEVLRSKEREMETLAIEIEALRVVAPLLSDDGDHGAANADPQPEHAAEWQEKARGWP